MVAQTTSQALFELTAVCLNSSFESCSPVVNGVVHHTLPELTPCLSQPMSQLDHVADWSLVHSLLHHAPDAVVHRVQIKSVGWPHVRTDELWDLAESVLLSRVSTLTRDIDIAIPSVFPSVCLSVCLSVAFRYSMQTAILQTMLYCYSFSPYGSPIILVL